MCLTTLYKKLDMKNWKKNKPQWIKVYKVVVSDEHCKKWITSNQSCILKAGLNQIPEAVLKNRLSLRNLLSPIKVPLWKSVHNAKYRPFYHLWTTYTAAKHWGNASDEAYDPEKIITCYVHKDWIKYVGIQNRQGVVVATQFIAPSYPNQEPNPKTLKKFGLPIPKSSKAKKETK